MGQKQSKTSGNKRGPEAALTVLIPLGLAGLHRMPAITLGIVALLVILYLSYRQTTAAYPGVGGRLRRGQGSTERNRVNGFYLPILL